MKLAVIGAGTMGNGIAHVFAQKGHKVSLIDIDEGRLEKALTTIEKNLGRQLAKERITEAEMKSTLENITTSTKAQGSIDNCDLIVEAATENKELKLKIFKELDEHSNAESILATNTSSISITEIAAATNRPEKVIGMHFMNPVPIMKLVEVIKGKDTSDKVTADILQLSKDLGKIPVEVNDAPGFVANRILMPMINEAVYTLYEGVSGVEEIDTVMQLGMAHPMGPLQLADFIGLDVCLSIIEVLEDGFGSDKYAPCPLLEELVAVGDLGVKTGKGFYEYDRGSKEKRVSDRFR